ncbi:MAG: DNA repair protein RecO, partial [Rugosibacter sp.]
EAQYAFQVERGPVKKVGAGDTADWANEAFFRGKTLLDMAADDYSDPQTRLESRALMRQLIAYHLGGKPLQSRRVFMELQEL